MAVLTGPETFVPRTLAGRPRVRRIAAGIIAALMLGAAARAQERPRPTEDDLKAVYLLKFTEYIHWPPGVLERIPGFTACVVADNAFTKLITDVMQGATYTLKSPDGQVIGQRPIGLHRPESAAMARQCQVLYISRAELERSDWLVEALENSAVLMVSDAPDFLKRGGTIALVLENNRVRYDVSLPAAKRSGLTINSRLLRSARKVVEAGGPR